MVEAETGFSRDFTPNGLSSDAWLGTRLTLVQPKGGHRVGSDAALLAAAIDVTEGRVADIGAGVGAVGLALLRGRERLTADLIEIDGDLVQLARQNAELNALSQRLRVLELDILDARARREAGLAEGTADAVVTNPPFFDSTRVRASANDARRRAHVFPAGEHPVAPLVGWIRASVGILKPGGRFVMIHRPEALAAILEAAENRLGALALLPVHPRAGAAAHRLLVSAIKGSRAPLSLRPGLHLHQADGRLTEEADSIHRGEALIDWGV
jgi:tRNA1(Val) A37 N6-methylase TrmN6